MSSRRHVRQGGELSSLQGSQTMKRQKVFADEKSSDSCRGVEDVSTCDSRVLG